MRGLGEEGEPSWHSGTFVVTCISPMVIILLCVSEQQDTYSSPRALVISIPEFTFLVIAIEFEVLISYLSLVIYIVC